MLHRSTAFSATTLLTAALLTSAPATAVGESCQGRPATIVGTGADVLGTPGDDVIVTGASKATYAGDGNDLICVSASAGEEIYVNAGRGDDSVVDASTSPAQGTSLIWATAWTATSAAPTPTTIECWPTVPTTTSRTPTW